MRKGVSKAMREVLYIHMSEGVREGVSEGVSE